MISVFVKRFSDWPPTLLVVLYFAGPMTQWLLNFIWYVNDLNYKITNRVGDQSDKRLTKTNNIFLSY